MTDVSAATLRKPGQAQESFDRLWCHVLTQIAPACVVINQSDEIVRYFGQTGRYLEPSPGAASFNLFTLLRPELRQPARGLLQQVREHGQRRTQPHLSIPLNGVHQLITLIVAPVGGEAPTEGSAIVAFHDEGAPVALGAQAEEKTESAAEQELRALRLQLSAISADLEAANAELMSANEEYQSVNEELQSTNEELETAKEELQSTNEELQTVNAELNIRNEELARANSDLRNYLEAPIFLRCFSITICASKHLRRPSRT